MKGAVIHSLTAGNYGNVPCLSISKFTLEPPTTAQRGKQRYSSTLTLTLALDGDGWSTPRFGHFTSGKERRYPFYGRPGGPRASLEGENFRPQPEFDPRTIHSVARLYTDSAIPARLRIINNKVLLVDTVTSHCDDIFRIKSTNKIYVSRVINL